MDYSIISRYLEGNASEKDVQEIFQWIESEAKNRKEFIQYKKLWALTSRSMEDVNAMWNPVSEKISFQKKRKLTYSQPWIVAAGFLLALGLGMLLQYFLPEKYEEQFVYQSDIFIKVPLGQMSDIILPDGTSVQLNSGTKLTLSKNFISGDRTVTLEGEAFFDVEKDLAHPFVIKTQSLDFKVYGTSFNIQAYPEDKIVNSTLVMGSMGIIGKNGAELTKLRPGENATFFKDGRNIKVTNVSLDLFTSWKDGLITFRNEKLKDIAKKIERWYNVEIIIQNWQIGDELYMGSILKNKPIDQILEVLALTSSFKYKIEPRSDKPTLIYWK